MASLHEGTDHGASSPSLPPAQLQAQHYLLSPVPASQASPSSSKPGATGTTPDSTTSVNLYPLEPVPPHLLCAICTLPYENPVHFLPCCHVFCLECIQLWIGMNLSDDLLQNELRRAYPAGDDLLHASSLSESEPFTYELARMDNDRSRSGTSGAFYDSYSGLPPMAQVHQRQVAIILENREMPKCPMCRTALHIHGWDRIEEQIKVPISVGPRPQSTPSTEWFERSANQRPVSGVQRRRLRSDRNHLGRRGLGRQDSIGEEDEEEEIEMEHVGARGQDVSPSPSSFGRHPHSRRDRTNPSQHHQFPRPVYPNGGFNYEDDDMDIDDQQSPTTAIIGRRPSEWMRYQQRQLQAHQAQQQSNRQQSNQTSDRYDDQQEQIRRLYLEQESQEELLRTLTARAASILEAGNAQRQTPPNTALSSSTHSLSTTQSGATPENNERDLSSDDREGDQQNTQLRRSMLHVDTSVTRSSSRQSQERSRQVSREVPSPRSPETAIHFANRTEASTVERDGDQNQDDQEETSDDNSSIIDALQQGTRAWQRPSSLRLDLEESEQRLVLSLGEAPEHGAQSDGESQGYSRSPLSSSSVSSATPSSGVQSSTLALSSPTNTHSFSFRTSSTFSHHMTQMSSDTTFSQQSPGLTNQWDQPLGLQMPTIDNDRHHDETPSTGPGSVGLVLERESLDDNLEEMWRGTQTETLEEAPSSTRTRTNEDQHLETTGDEQTEETGSTSLPGSITSSTSESRHPTYFLQSSEIHIWKSAGSSSTSGASPMVRELDIHSPIVTTTEGSVTTIADMQIDADILARARSGSVVLSDDDEALPATFFRTHRHSPSSVTSSPIDSPIPTPSTARPRQRFPAGIRLVGEGDEEVEQEDVDEEEEEAYEHAQEEEVAAETVSHRQSLAPAEVVQESSDTTDVLEEEHQQQDEVVDDPLSNQPETQGIQDPLSTIETPNLQESVPRTTSLRSTMSSPPPLPVPLDTTEDGVGGEPSSLAAELNRAAQQEHTTPGRSRPTSVVDHSRHQSAQDRNGASTATSRPASIHAQTQATSDHAPQAQQAQAQTQVEEEEEEEAPQPWPSSSSRSSSTPPASTSSSSSPSFTGARRTEDHVQYRTLVRYQPRLPKAHVMSDLISQIKVECPQRTHGCLETMEMQQMPQHGREQCRFRPVMCPRARCGLWMRADQILEHILLVEQPAPAASGTLGSTTRPQRNKSSTRRLNRTPRGSAKDEVHSHAASSTSGNSTSSLSPSPSSSLIPPCPGLTWEREQLARATGIIGQLNEENTSLRQMVRQLQQQNSKLVKEKDRFQRYANLVDRD